MSTAKTQLKPLPVWPGFVLSYFFLPLNMLLVHFFPMNLSTLDFHHLFSQPQVILLFLGPAISYLGSAAYWSYGVYRNNQCLRSLDQGFSTGNKTMVLMSILFNPIMTSTCLGLLILLDAIFMYVTLPYTSQLPRDSIGFLASLAIYALLLLGCVSGYVLGMIVWNIKWTAAIQKTIDKISGQNTKLPGLSQALTLMIPGLIQLCYFLGDLKNGNFVLVIIGMMLAPLVSFGILRKQSKSIAKITTAMTTKDMLHAGI